MKTASRVIAITDNIIMNNIYLIRNQKVMIDRDLAQLYQVETKLLKETVRRNISGFPKDFMFVMSKQELENRRTQNATPKKTGKA